MRRQPRRLTTCVSLLWLNLAMLPCTMAASGDEHLGKPDCPPAAASEHHGHSSGHAADADHGMHEGDAGHAAADQDASSHPCMANDNCCELDDVVSSDGAKKLEREAGALPPISFASVHAESIQRSVCSLRATGPPPAFAGSVRRHALNCVYRD